MDPRFILRTHTGSLKPGNYSILISKCTHPDRRSSPESVARRLGIMLENNSKSSIAKFTVNNASSKNRGFGFLFDNMLWTWKGHVINTALSVLNKVELEDTEPFLGELTLLERVLYLRYYLETEGALLLKLAHIIKNNTQISYEYLKNNIQAIFQEIYQEYIDISPNIRTRVRLQKSAKRLLKPYDTGTLPHKIRPHIDALEDLGIIKEEKRGDGELYSSPALERLSERLTDIYTLENICRDYAYFQLIVDAFDLKPELYNELKHKSVVRDTIYTGYSIMKEEATGTASINALIDWTCIKMLAQDNVYITHQDVQLYLDTTRKNDPSSIRYHVDGRGRIAYLILQ